MARVVSLFLPTWPTDRSRRKLGAAAPPVEASLVLIGRVGGRRVVLATDGAALAVGLRVGMPVTKVQALVPGLIVMDADPAADAEALAQTAGSIAAAFNKKPEAVAKARVQARFIQVGEGSTAALGDAITRATNTQNRINRQDFVALDPEQQRLRTELNIDGVIYNYKTAEGTIRDQKTFDIEEATVALACANADLALPTLAKREIGRLWEDTSKAPYKALFNPSVSGHKVWQAVRIMRMIDVALQEQLGRLTGRDTGFIIHGNRYIAHSVFQRLAPLAIGSGVLPVDFEATVRDHVNSVLSDLITKANEIYPQAYLAQLFKNQKKLVEITSAIQTADPTLFSSRSDA